MMIIKMPSYYKRLELGNSKFWIFVDSLVLKYMGRK